jgi:hypothetical protein
MLLPESTVSRSFTRFLLPLTDIMIILFSMFLLMPQLEEKKGAPTPGISPGWQADQQRQSQEELQRYRRLESQPLSDRSLVRIMHIDRDTGDLWVPRDSQRITLTPENFSVVLAQDLREAQQMQKELFYMLLAPARDVQGTPDRPLRQDRERYAQLFREAQQKHPQAKISYLVVFPASGR